MKAKVWKVTWPPSKLLPRPFSLWVVRYGRKYHEMTRYFDSFSEAIEYVTSGHCAGEYRYIQMGVGPVDGYGHKA